MQAKNPNLLRDRSVDTRLIINVEVDEKGKKFYMCVFGDNIRGTLGILKVGAIRMSPDVFEMVLEDMHQNMAGTA